MTREDGADQPFPDTDPVADGDVDALVEEAAGHAAADGAVCHPDVELPAVGGGYASRREAGIQLFGELVSPAELGQVIRQRKAPSR